MARRTTQTRQLRKQLREKSLPTDLDKEDAIRLLVKHFKSQVRTGHVNFVWVVCVCVSCVPQSAARLDRHPHQHHPHLLSSVSFVDRPYHTHT